MSTKKLTEKELIETQQMTTYFLDARDRNFAENLLNLEELLPMPYHMNNLDEVGVSYMSKPMEEFINSSTEEAIDMGFEKFFEKFVLRETWEPMMPYMLQLITDDDESAVLTFFQKVKSHQSGYYEWILTTTKLIKSKNSLISLDTPIRQLDKLGNKMYRILDENAYVKKNFKKYAQLTKREKEILTLVCEGHSNPQIADRLFISRRTVEQHRKNINKKLDTNKLSEMIKFAYAFDMIQ